MMTQRADRRGGALHASRSAASGAPLVRHALCTDRLAQRRGFTLIELMVVVAAIGLLAAIAVPIFLGYVRDSKLAEATQNMKSLGDGAMTYFQEEHPRGDGQVWIRRYPEGAICTSSGASPGAKQMPLAADFDEPVWRALRFQLTKAHYYRYCYDGTPEAFETRAEASLEGGPIDSIFTLQGGIAGNGSPHLSAVREVL